MTYTVTYTDYAGGNPGSMEITAGSLQDALRSFRSVMPYNMVRVVKCPNHVTVWGAWAQ